MTRTKIGKQGGEKKKGPGRRYSFTGGKKDGTQDTKIEVVLM